MLKNDGIGEIFDLNRRWECLLDDVIDERFDLISFQALAVDTFAFLFPYHATEEFAREVMSLIFRIKEFACFGASRKSYTGWRAARHIAHEFCEQVTGCWALVDGVVDERKFRVHDRKNDYIIDTKNFDLSEMINKT